MLRIMRSARQRLTGSRDDGVALVAAISVALIGVALTTLVVTQAIIVTNDAARDRVRTSEIHSAEGAVDATLKELEGGLLCEPSFNPLVIGEGTSQVETTITIEYFDEGGAALTCSGSSDIDGDAVRALVTGRAVPTQPAPGIDPERSIQAEVRLTPREGLSVGASIFADSTLEAQNSGEVVSSNPEEHPATVWIDSGNYDCRSSFKIDGSLVVVDGGISMRNSCQITGDAWAKNFFDVRTSVNGWRVAGNTTVASGDFFEQNNNSFGRDLRVSGDINGSPTVAGSICSANIGDPCDSFENYVPRGFPEVDYVPADWAPDLQEKSQAEFVTDMIDAGGFKSSSAEDDFRDDSCNIKKQWLKDPFHLNAGESQGSLYDLRTCDVMWEGVTLKVYQDTAFFVDDFYERNGFRVESGDGEEHDVWIIVPWGSDGDVKLSNQSNVLAPVNMFIYTPGTVQIDNQQTINGQIYGQTVHVSNNFKLSYVPMGIPGVDLGGTLSLANSGYSVEIEKKRELRN